MKDFDDGNLEVKKAVIYCRVSGKKQTKDGSGLSSQEHRCRQHANTKGYEVEAVFPDDVSGGGDFMNRPGMVALLKHLDDNPHEHYVVIFDDLKRYARDTEFHLNLRRQMQARNATRECLNFNFEDTPENKFFETIVAANGTLEREQMGRQTHQKTKARLEKGFWTRRAPVGYKYIPAKEGGKIMVKDEPLASIVKEALEGYATGRFSTQTEMKRFLEADPRYPKDMPNGELRPQTVVRLMEKVLYAGYLEAPSWGVSLRKAQHEPIISLETFQKIQERRKGKATAPTRKNLHKDFPLRGSVCCASCDTPLTAGYSTGKYRKYPYYLCQQRGCDQYGKSIPRAKLEGEFEDLLKELQPSKGLFDLVVAMLKEAWAIQMQKTASIAKSFKQDLVKIEKDINQLIERIMDANQPRVIQAYETRIDELEKKKLLYQEKAQNTHAPRHSFEETLELSLRFLSNPCKIWASGQYNLQKLVLRLVLSERLQYCRIEGLRTPKTTLPINMLGDFCAKKNKMVLQQDLELQS